MQPATCFHDHIPKFGTTEADNVVNDSIPLDIADNLQLPPEQSLMVGDRLETDLAMGRTAGMATALTLTGATDRCALINSPVQPD